MTRLPCVHPTQARRLTWLTARIRRAAERGIDGAAAALQVVHQAAGSSSTSATSSEVSAELGAEVSAETIDSFSTGVGADSVRAWLSEVEELRGRLAAEHELFDGKASARKESCSGASGRATLSLGGNWWSRRTSSVPWSGARGERR